jgi:hypothetical protein
MQFTKDSFYMALRERLAALNPQRTVTLSGATRPAVIVAENELVIPVEPLADAFYLEWAGAQEIKGSTGKRALMRMDCVVSYHTLGSCTSGVDRGRILGELDTELMTICQPSHTAKQDYSQTPSAFMGSNIFWSMPELGKVSGSEGPAKLPGKSQGVRLERQARVNIFFFPEVDFL